MVAANGINGSANGTNGHHANGAGSPTLAHTMSGRVAFITGASGIGYATACQLAARGASIAIADLKLPAAEAAVSNIAAEFHVPTLAVSCNVANNEEVEAAVAETVSKLGGLHFALNAAGMPSKGGLVGEYPVDDWKRMIDVHCTGAFLCCRAEINAMLASGGGSIVNVSSLAGVVSLGPQVAYIAAKHAVIGLTKTVAGEYGRQNIRCNAVAPGFIETPLFDQMAAAAGQQKSDASTKLGALVPLGRTGRPEEVASVITFLLSDDASYVSGGLYNIEGGFLNCGRME